MATPTINAAPLAALDPCPPDVREILQSAMSGAELSKHLLPSPIICVAKPLAMPSPTLSIATSISLMSVSSAAVFAASDAAPKPLTLIHSLSKKSSAALAKLGTAAPPKSASRAACPAISTGFSTAICSVPSNVPSPKCTSTPFLQWSWITALQKQECPCATIS